METAGTSTLPGFPRTLFGQIAVAFLTLLILYGWTLGENVYSQLSSGLRKSRQLVHWDLAGKLAAELGPLVDDGGSPAAYRRLLSFRGEQPDVDVYLLDSEGFIELSLSTHNIAPGAHVDLNPIKAFLGKDGDSLAPLLGDDPASQQKQGIFSASALTLNGESFYLYLVFANAAERGLQQGILDHVVVSGVSMLTLLATLVCALTGLVLFSIIIKPFRSALAMIFRFQAGDFSERLPQGKNNEVGVLARALNSLGDAFSGQIRELARREQVRQQLVANVAHDLRGPLSLIRGGINRFARLPAEQEERAAALSALVSGIDRNSTMLERLLTELFELSQLDAKELAPQFAAAEADDLCRDLAIRFLQRAEDAGILLSVDVEPDLPSVICDAVLIERALSNLVENALRYVARGGTIVIGARSAGTDVVVSIADTGCGIPSDQLEHVFERNVQLSGDGEKGLSGLGLAIVQRIVEVHGGQVSVESEVDRGTTFSFRLPTIAAAPQPAGLE